MRILVIGSGGREHALVWKIRQSPLCTDLIVTPGNGGTQLDGVRSADVKPDDILGLLKLAREEKVDLVVPGPELPLVLGITDAMNVAGIPCFGPDRYCAQLEGSKYFAKDLMKKAGVPTAECAVFNDAESAHAFVAHRGAPLVIKADGLAAGKGVVVARTTEEALQAVDAIMKDHAMPDARSLLKNASKARKFPSSASATASPPCPCPQPRTTRPPTTATKAPIPAAWAPTALPPSCPTANLKR